MQRDFYKSLFSSNSTIQVKGSKYHNYLHNIPKNTDHTKLIKDADIEIEELEYAIRSSKQNKAPGPDGFSNEFFKFFINSLKHWIFRYYKEAIGKNQFSEIALEGIITCIPKQGKLRNDLKNWRPLTLLNSIYKFWSSIIANRLKTTLPSLINEDQTGFISGRFIGENTRMIYDSIDYCNTFQQEGILIILDFSKAFDTIEWSFIEYCLNLFNFGENFIKFIKLCQRNSKSRVEQNGHLSSFITLERGCRQGDPVSPYIFVLCAEIPSHVLRESREVEGLIVYNKEFKVSQYADDTTLLLKPDYNTVVEVLRILKWFKNISGLDINKDKTNIVKLGATRGRSIPWQGKFGFKWATNFEILGIHYDINHMKEITEINIFKKVCEIKKLIRIWQCRNLTPYGKVTIIKSLLLSKITHILLSLPSPNFFCIKEINNVFSNFLWSGKPPKWRKEILEGEICFGGLKLHNISLFDKTLKLGWIKRFLQSNSKWTIIPLEFDLEKCLIFGVDYVERVMELTSNKFWLDVLDSLKLLWSNNLIENKLCILNSPLWYNPTFRFPLRQEWLTKGITMVSDLLENKLVLSREDFENKYSVQINFLDFHHIKSTITDYLAWREKADLNEPIPKNSALNMLLNMDNKGCAKMYKLLKGANTHILDNIITVWNKDSEYNLCTNDLSTSFNLHHANYGDTYLKYIQFRTLHKRFYTNEKLFKMGIKTSSQCTFCKDETDSVEHMFIKCRIVRDLWAEVRNWIVEMGVPNYYLTEEKIILGEFEKSVCINTIILLTKKVIYNAMKENKKPHLLYVKNETKNFYFQEKYRLYIKEKRLFFERKYALLYNIYEEI